MIWRGALRAATIALFATAASVAAPAPARAQDLSCDEPTDREVRELVFRGNRALSGDDLALRVRTTPSALLRRSIRVPLGAKRCLDIVELRRDLFRLKNYYLERGFYSTKVDTLVEPLGGGRDVVRVVFNIDEGLPVILRSYDVTGLEGIPDSAGIMNRRQLRVGQPFDRGLFVADMDSILQRLRNAGFYRATLVNSHDLNQDSLIARVAITVLPGKRARFGEPVVQVTPVDERGQQLSTRTVRRVLGISPGDQYSDRAIIEAQRSLFQLGTYRHIEVAPLPDSLQPGGDTIVVLQVSLTEDYMRRVDSEFGWATLDCGRLRMQYTDLNFASTARRLELTAQASKIGYGEPLATRGTRDVCTLNGNSPLAEDSAFSSQLHYHAGIALRQPRLLGTRWVPTLSVYSERRGEYKAYLRTTNVGGDFSATRDVAERTQLRLGYSIEYGRTTAPDAVLCALFSRCDDDSRRRILEFATLGVASATVVRIRTDNLVSPTRGSVMRAETRTSASSLLGTSSSLFFNKGSGDIGWYRPFGGHNVLALRFRAGAVVGRRLSDTLAFVPPQERLYAGGPTSVRGFQSNELGEVVYIARAGEVARDSSVVGPDSVWRFSVPATSGFERVVPLGGNTLFVANLEYRIRDPIFLPDYVQYTLFLDAGDAWNRPSPPRIKWTPGAGVRLLTPVGPIQMNVGFNPYKRETGPIYFEDPALAASAISPLYCVSPGNIIDLKRKDGVLQPVQPGCDRSYTPPERKQWYKKLTFTFSIGPDF
jgi:outer membrane protein assembly factor BamA